MGNFQIGAFGGSVLFYARTVPDTAVGAELHRSDGTQAGTGLVREFNPGFRDSFLRTFTAFNDQIYFEFSGDLWRSDGTDGNTVLVDDLIGFSNPGIALGSLYYMGGSTLENRGQLWKSGTGIGTAMEVAAINPGGFAQVNSITELNGALYFSATDGGVNNLERELWTSDGVSGASLVKDILPGAPGSNPGKIIRAGNRLFFEADDGVNGRELWTSDGTGPGTTLVADLVPGAKGGQLFWLTAFGSEVFFAADNGTSGRELWKSDGTPEGTVQVADINPGFLPGLPEPSIGSRHFIEIGGYLYFPATDGVHGIELWRTDGTAAGTMMVADLNPGERSSSPEELTKAGGKLYFTAYTASLGREVFEYDPPLNATLTIRRIGSNVIVEWPHDPARDFQLQSSHDLKVWTDYTQPTSIANGMESVTIPIGSAPYFLRLAEQ